MFKPKDEPCGTGAFLCERHCGPMSWGALGSRRVKLLQSKPSAPPSQPPQSSAPPPNQPTKGVMVPQAQAGGGGGRGTGARPGTNWIGLAGTQPPARRLQNAVKAAAKPLPNCGQTAPKPLPNRCAAKPPHNRCETAAKPPQSRCQTTAKPLRNRRTTAESRAQTVAQPPRGLSHASHAPSHRPSQTHRSAAAAPQDRNAVPSHGGGDAYPGGPQKASALGVVEVRRRPVVVVVGAQVRVRPVIVLQAPLPVSHAAHTPEDKTTRRLHRSGSQMIPTRPLLSDTGGGGGVDWPPGILADPPTHPPTSENFSSGKK